MDYKKVGLKAGLEIHQQLNTGKLFSRTPSLLRSEKPDYVVMRKLHKVAGESGEVDEAVEHESEKDKTFHYEGYDDTISLVELDESPPQELDREALEEVLKIALLLNCEIYSTSQIMRKTVIDGSNTSGFQRTVLIGHSGYVETSFGKVRIESIALEEDAARLIKRGEKEVRFRLDRLGIPLVEITTKPDMKTPEEVREAALKIGEIVRSCKVRRGIGTIRQDLNVSIKGHDRVEIKGFQDPKIMIDTVDKEIERQQNELKEGKKEGEVRNCLESGETKFLRPMPGKARMYPETDLELLRISRDQINGVKKRLPMLRSEMREVLKKKGLSDELIDLVLDDHFDEFSVLMRVHDRDANLVAKMVALWRNDFAKKRGKSFEEVKERLSEAVLEKILEEVDSGDLEKVHVQEVMEKVLDGEDVEKAVKVEKASDDEVEEEIRKIVKEKPGMRPNAYMGLIMGKMKGKVDAKSAMEIVSKILDEKR